MTAWPGPCPCPCPEPPAPRAALVLPAQTGPARPRAPGAEHSSPAPRVSAARRRQDVARGAEARAQAARDDGGLQEARGAAARVLREDREHPPWPPRAPGRGRRPGARLALPPSAAKPWADAPCFSRRRCARPRARPRAPQEGARRRCGALQPPRAGRVTPVCLLQKKDPAQFLQVHGRACKVHLDSAVALAAESPVNM